MPRYVARVDLTGSSSDAEASFSALADSAEDTAGRIQGAFDDASKEAGGSLDDIADSAEASIGKVSGSLDDLAGTAAEKATAVSGAFDESFATVGSSAELMQAKFAEVLEGMVADTSTNAALISARLDEAFAKSSLAAKEMAETSSASLATVGGASAVGGAAKSAEGGGLVGGLSKLGEFTVVGGIAAVAGSVDVAMKYTTQLTSLKTAVKDAGDSWGAFAPQLKKADDAGAHLGFNMTDVAEALEDITTATGKPKAALSDLVGIENYAALKNISLAESAELFTKVYAGSPRAVTALGLNLDIQSGKLTSVQADTEALTKAQLAQQVAENNLAESHITQSAALQRAIEAQKAGYAEVLSGQVRGASAVALTQSTGAAVNAAIAEEPYKQRASLLSYDEAVLTVTDDTRKLAQAHSEVADVLAAIDARTKGAAAAQALTLPGEWKVAKAEVHDLGVEFGQTLTPDIEKAGHALEEGVGWLTHNKDAAEALAGVVGGVLSIAVATFAEQKIAKFAKGVGQAVGDLHKLEQGAVSVAQKILHIGSPTSAPPSSSASQTGQVGTAAETSSGQVTGLGAAAEASSGQIAGLGAASETSASQIGGLGAASETTAGTISASSTEAQVSLTAIGTASEATAATEEVAGAEGGEGIAAMLGPIGLVAFAALEVAEHWKLVKEVAGDVWHFLDSNVVHPMERGFDWLKDEISSHLGEIETDAKKFGPALLLLLGPIGLIGAAAIELVTHWKSVSRTFDDVEHDLKRGWDRLEGDVLGLWHTVGSDTDKGVHDVVGFVEGLPGDVEHLFADADEWLVDAGLDLLKGLVKGIGDGEKDVLKAAEAIGKHVLHDLTHPWDIASPSKKTVEAGGFLVGGVGVGAKNALPGLLGDMGEISQSVLAELASKLNGRDIGHRFMVDFGLGISDGRQLVQSALTDALKKAEKTSAMANFGVTVGGQRLGLGSSVTHNYNLNNPVIQANDPGQLARKLDLIARRKHAVRT